MMLNGNKTFGLCFGSGVLFPKGSKAHDLRIWKLDMLKGNGKQIYMMNDNREWFKNCGLEF
jgi:hypothetical protein